MTAARGARPSPRWAAAILAAVACGQPDAPPPDRSAIVLRLAPEDIVLIARGHLASGPRISGSLAPGVRSVVRAEAAGAVLQIGPELGDRVKAGELLARIAVKALGEAASSAQSGVQAAEAQLVLARREAERIEVLVDGGASPQRELERARGQISAAESNLVKAQAQLAASRAQLGDATARAPLDGVVARREVSRGDVVAPGTELYELIDPSTMRLEAAVASDELAAVAPGKPVMFSVRGYPGQQFDGAISRVGPTADPLTRQIRVLVDIPNPGNQLIAGLYAEGRIVVAARDAVIAPAAAIDTSGDQPTALRVSHGVIERVTVGLGTRDDRAEIVEIASGLSVDDVVVLPRAGRRIVPGVRVELPQRRPPGAAAAPPLRSGSTARLGPR